MTVMIQNNTHLTLIIMFALLYAAIVYVFTVFQDTQQSVTCVLYQTDKLLISSGANDG